MRKDIAVLCSHCQECNSYCTSLFPSSSLPHKCDVISHPSSLPTPPIPELCRDAPKYTCPTSASTLLTTLNPPLEISSEPLSQCVLDLPSPPPSPPPPPQLAKDKSPDHQKPLSSPSPYILYPRYVPSPFPTHHMPTDPPVSSPSLTSPSPTPSHDAHARNHAPHVQTRSGRKIKPPNFYGF
ncbi:uncharacterized protein LOC135154466 [Lytechinus pictus]|uniref:uncharacterized protein LOC135154466 n=1 Tax=Lytechinus pictus TaxID=7653 RepID=UPI0030BA20EB